jgi:hypothetical protein
MEVGDSGSENFDAGGCGHGSFVGEPAQGVRVQEFAGAPVDDGEAAVAFKIWAYIPAINASGGPGFALIRFLMDNYMGAGRGNGMGVEDIVAFQLGPGRELGVEAGRAEHVEGEDGLRNQVAPVVEGEVRIKSTQTG